LPFLERYRRFFRIRPPSTSRAFTSLSEAAGAEGFAGSELSLGLAAFGSSSVMIR
jgi:hypothetical protein